MMYKNFFSGRKPSYRSEYYKASNSDFLQEGMLQPLLYIDINTHGDKK